MSYGRQRVRRNATDKPDSCNAPVPPKPGAKKKAALSRAEEKELAGAPDAIERAEQQVSALEQKLADPSTYSASGTDVPRLVAELDAAKAEVARLMARWEELEAKKSG